MTKVVADTLNSLELLSDTELMMLAARVINSVSINGWTVAEFLAYIEEEQAIRLSHHLDELLAPWE